jgi:ANTAR domain
MERLGIDAERAFAYLRRISQTEHRKLITICSEIVETRRLPSPQTKVVTNDIGSARNRVVRDHLVGRGGAQAGLST